MEAYERALKETRSRTMRVVPFTVVCLNCNGDICEACYGCKCAPCDCPERQPGWVQ
jgi:hypothetical protein